MDNEIGFSYGVMSPSLEKQANEQGYTLGDKWEKYDKLKFSLNMLGMHDIIPESQLNKGFQKLNNKMVKDLKPLD